MLGWCQYGSYYGPLHVGVFGLWAAADADVAGIGQVSLWSVAGGRFFGLVQFGVAFATAGMQPLEDLSTTIVSRGPAGTTVSHGVSWSVGTGGFYGLAQIAGPGGLYYSAMATHFYGLLQLAFAPLGGALAGEFWGALQIGCCMNNYSASFHGLAQLSPAYNEAGDFYGLSQISVVNLADRFYGLAQLSLAYNEAGDFFGLSQVSVVNHADRFYGFGQLGVVNHADLVYGIQGGAVNLAAESTDGLQAGVVNAYGEQQMNGVQVGVVNYGFGTVRGLQVGFINYTHRLCGVQLGAGNIATDNVLPIFVGLLIGADCSIPDSQVDED